MGLPFIRYYHTCTERAVLVILLFQIIYSTSLFGQNESAGHKGFLQYKITYWTTDDGLPGNTMVSLCQDPQGYLWIGSYQGLIRFDGNKFRDFNDSNTPGLVSHHIKVALSESNGNLWLGTGSGLVLYSQGKFFSMGGPEHQFFIESMSLDENSHKIWIGTRSAGLFAFDTKTKHYEKIESIFSKDLIYAVVHDTDGGIWVGGGKFGLGYFKNGSWSFYTKEKGMPSAEINSIYQDGQTLYIGTPSGLFVKNDGKFGEVSEFYDIGINNVKKDRNGNLWVLTTIGVYKQNQDKTWQHINQKNGLSDNDVRDIYFDTEGSIWLATYRGGVNQIKATKFMTFAEIEGIDANVIRVVREFSQDTYIALSTDGKLYSIAKNKVTPLPIKTELARVYDLLVDKDKNLLIASFTGLLLIKPDGTEKLFTEKDGLPTRQLRVLFQDSKNNVWIGTQNQGILKIIMGARGLMNFEKFKSDEINSPFIMSITEDKNGNLLVGTNTGGINIIGPDGSVKIYNKKDGLISNLIFNTYSDPSGVIWLATSDGISRLENGTSYNYTSENGLQQESVFDIVEDSLGYLWMSSAIGINRVEKKQLNDYKDGKINSIYWKTYGKNDELRKSECSGTAKILQSTNGTIWVPMSGGVVAVDPLSIEINKRPPEVYIEKITVDDHELNLQEPMIIPPDNQRIVISYTALCLRYPKTTRYKYKLENFDRQWLDGGGTQQIAYTNLPKGDYTFNVIASNNDGIWNETGASIVFTVEPFYYETVWFYALLALATGLGMFSYTRWRTKGMTLKNLELEKEVEKRTVQLKQKSDSLEEENREKSSILSIVSHDLRAPFNKISGLVDLMRMTDDLTKDQKEEYLEHIKHSVEQGNHLIRNLLDARSLDRGAMKPVYADLELDKFIHDFELATNIQLLKKKQELKVQNEAEGITISTDHQLLTRILDNLVSNASKFSEKGKLIYLRIWKEHKSLNFSVRDEGPGISEDDQKKMFRKFQMLTAKPTAGEGSTGLGLAISKALTEKLQGTISVKSVLGEGTEFLIRLPYTTD